MNAPLTSAQHDLLSKSARQSQVIGGLQADVPSHALIWFSAEENEQLMGVKRALDPAGRTRPHSDLPRF